MANNNPLRDSLISLGMDSVFDGASSEASKSPRGSESSGLGSEEDSLVPGFWNNNSGGSISADDLITSATDLLQSKTTFTLDESTSLQEEVDRLKIIIQSNNNHNNNSSSIKSNGSLVNYNSPPSSAGSHRTLGRSLSSSMRRLPENQQLFCENLDDDIMERCNSSDDNAVEGDTTTSAMHVPSTATAPSEPSTHESSSSSGCHRDAASCSPLSSSTCNDDDDFQSRGDPRRAIYQEQKRKLASILRKSVPKPVDFVLFPSTTTNERSLPSRMDAIFEVGSGSNSSMLPKREPPQAAVRTCENESTSTLEERQANAVVQFPSTPTPQQQKALITDDDADNKELLRDGVGRHTSPASVMLDLRTSLEKHPLTPPSATPVVHVGDERLRAPRLPERRPSFEEQR